MTPPQVLNFAIPLWGIWMNCSMDRVAVTAQVKRRYCAVFKGWIEALGIFIGRKG